MLNSLNSRIGGQSSKFVRLSKNNHLLRKLTGDYLEVRKRGCILAKKEMNKIEKAIEVLEQQGHVYRVEGGKINIGVKAKNSEEFCFFELSDNQITKLGIVHFMNEETTQKTDDSDVNYFALNAAIDEAEEAAKLAASENELSKKSEGKSSFQKATIFALIMGFFYTLLPVMFGGDTNVNTPTLFVMGVIAGFILFYGWRILLFMMGYSYIRK